MAGEPGWTRRLAWEGLLNSRDLGGYPTADGRETRWGAIVRSDDLAALTAAGRAALVAYGVRTIIDLRRPAEASDFPNPFANPGTDGVGYVPVPILDPSVDPVDEQEPDSLAHAYQSMLDRFGRRVRAVLTAIADAPDGGVLVHCVGGKDRTGLVSALLLEVAGVERETVAADYALSAEYLMPREKEYLRNGPGERAERERIVAKYSPRAEVMLETLAHLDHRYGGAEPYLRDAGVRPDDIVSIRRRLLT